MKLVRRAQLRRSRQYYWFVVLAGIAGGYCALDGRVNTGNTNNWTDNSDAGGL